MRIYFFLVFLLSSLFLLSANKILIPADTIVGLYHPYRDFYAKDYPRGIPFKNSLITDPVRQQYPWKTISIELIKKFQLPLWNPYSFAGYPLLANFQTGSFYFLNLLFIILPFKTAWNIYIGSQILLAMIFMYVYLRNLRISVLGSIMGGISFCLSGFFVAWLEWGNVLHTALWLPVILLSIDKINKKSSLKWHALFIFSLIASFLAGHLQIFFYTFILSCMYFLVRSLQNKKIQKIVIVDFFIFVLLTIFQWIPTAQFIFLSARSADLKNLYDTGWFIPWEHLIQFVVPDFFGNPATLNYWGTWNYAELLGYVGIVPISFSIYALMYRRDKKTVFYGFIFLASLLFALPTVMAKIPYALGIPFISTSQPTRLLFISDFSLSVLCALGFDFFMKQKNKLHVAFFVIFTALLSLWLFAFLGHKYIGNVSIEQIEVVRRNLLFPSSICIALGVILCSFFLAKSKKITNLLYFALILLTMFDLGRLLYKFTPYVDSSYLFPNTKALSFLQKNTGEYRIMTTDSKILPPNFSLMYKLQSIDGYDPLYLQRYGELIAASERSSPNISPPFGFNRIITPHNYDSKIIDLLGVKYILSLSDINSSKLTKVFQEGETRVYENKNKLPRAFFVKSINWTGNKYESINELFNTKTDLRNEAIVEKMEFVHPKNLEQGSAEVALYTENKVIIKTKNMKDGFLVLTDSFYPTWKATIDLHESTIYLTDYSFRGIFVLAGNHTIEFTNNLFSL